MCLSLSSAVVIDDALGPPPAGSVATQDKDAWIELLSEGTPAEAALRKCFYPNTASPDQPSLEDILENVVSNHDMMMTLWHEHQNQKMPDANLDVLFRTASDLQAAKNEKPLVVVNKLREICGEKNVLTFSDLDSAAAALEGADIAFIDFYLSAGEDKDAAIARIRNAKESLSKPKLLFFMSSIADLETQSEVKKEIGVKAAFFDVMSKASITPEFIHEKVTAKCGTFAVNSALVDVTKALVEATEQALSDFQAECNELEVHDLRLLDLARLDAEGESLSEYLTWLFSEAIAAKTRRNALPITLKTSIKSDDVGFTGQIQQGEVLFSLFSEIVFGPPVPLESNIRFGELIKTSDGKHYLILTPACDLQRCEPSKAVLCVAARATVLDSSKGLAEQKLYGKLGDGRLCHLYWGEQNEKRVYTLFEWQKDEIKTYTVRELKGNSFARIAIMNEIFAHEVKEEVLRYLGRVGTQIDPPPAITLSATLQWDYNGSKRQADAPGDQFVPALLTHAEFSDRGKSKSCKTVVLSDEFRFWARKKISESYGQKDIPVKMQNCLETLESKAKHILGGNFAVTDQDLTVKALKTSAEIAEMSRGLVEIDLVFPALDAPEDLQGR